LLPAPASFAIASPAPAAPEKTLAATSTLSKWMKFQGLQPFHAPPHAGNLRTHRSERVASCFLYAPAALARGILSTIYVTLGEPQTAADIEALYRKFYAGRSMVRIWAAGTLPELQHVAHTNFCDIGFALDNSGRRLVVVSCLDNLGKALPARPFRISTICWV